MTQAGWGDSTDCFRGRDKKFNTTELTIPTVVQPQTEDDAASSALTTFGEPIDS